jgi:hypothetical protein
MALRDGCVPHVAHLVVETFAIVEASLHEGGYIHLDAHGPHKKGTHLVEWADGAWRGEVMTARQGGEVARQFVGKASGVGLAARRCWFGESKASGRAHVGVFHDGDEEPVPLHPLIAHRLANRRTLADTRTAPENPYTDGVDDQSDGWPHGCQNELRHKVIALHEAREAEEVEEVERHNVFDSVDKSFERRVEALTTLQLVQVCHLSDDLVGQEDNHKPVAVESRLLFVAFLALRAALVYCLADEHDHDEDDHDDQIDPHLGEGPATCNALVGEALDIVVVFARAA